MVEVASNNDTNQEGLNGLAQSIPESELLREQPQEEKDLQNLCLGEENEENKKADDDKGNDVNLDAVEGKPVQEESKNPAESAIAGDVQGEQIKALLSKRMIENKEDMKCCDCAQKSSTHANVSFGTFICSDCARIHQEKFQMFKNYIKPLDSECWDTYQIRCLQAGGNKKFNNFMEQYEKNDCNIEMKYGGSSAQYYRRKLCAQVRNQPFDEAQPARSLQEETMMAGEYAGDQLQHFDQKFNISGSIEDTAKVIGNQFEKALGKFGKWASSFTKTQKTSAAQQVVSEDIPVPAQNDKEETPTLQGLD